jgi:hypothetical protein
VDMERSRSLSFDELANTLGVKASDSNAYPPDMNSHHAGTPENFTSFGGRGDGCGGSTSPGRSARRTACPISRFRIGADLGPVEDDVSLTITRLRCSRTPRPLVFRRKRSPRSVILERGSLLASVPSTRSRHR